MHPTQLGHVASYYYVQYSTVSAIAGLVVGEELKFSEIIHMLSHVSEFEELPVRHNEDTLNEELAKLVPYPVDMTNLDSPFTKTHLLLQAHFSRIPLPISDYDTDTKSVID